MSGSTCCFLTCIQISQEVGKVVWYHHLLKNFPVCCDIYSRNLYGSQWSRSRCFFCSFLTFLMIQQMLAIWSLVLLPFLNPACAVLGSVVSHSWTVALHAHLSMEFPGKNIQVGCHFPSSGDLPYPGIEPKSLTSRTLRGGSFTMELPGMPNPACTSGISQFTYCLSLMWRILNIILLACEMSVIIL